MNAIAVPGRILIKGEVVVVVAYNVTIVGNGYGNLKKFKLIFLGCVLRTAGSFF